MTSLREFYKISRPKIVTRLSPFVQLSFAYASIVASDMQTFMRISLEQVSFFVSLITN